MTKQQQIDDLRRELALVKDELESSDRARSISQISELVRRYLKSDGYDISPDTMLAAIALALLSPRIS